MGTSLGPIKKKKKTKQTLIQEFSQPVQSSLDKLNTPVSSPQHPRGGKKKQTKHMT